MSSARMPSPLRFCHKVGLVTAITLAATLSCVIPVPGVPGDPVPAPGVPASDLLLDAQPFPAGWEVLPCEPYCDDTEKAGQAERTFHLTGVPGHVIQQMFYFGSENDAEANFQRYEETTPFSPPPEIAYRSPIADQQYLRCGVDIVPACWAALRYGNYFVYFYFRLESGYDADGERVEAHGLKTEEVEAILRAMDERAADLLGLTSPS